MSELHTATVYLLAGEGPRGRRFLGGPASLVEKPGDAWRFISRSEAERHLGAAATLVRDGGWEVVEARLRLELIAPDRALARA